MNGYFDRVWRVKGRAALICAFRSLHRRGGDTLLNAVSDGGNSFPVIYLLAPYLEAAELDAHLGENAKYALWLTAVKAGDSERAERYAKMLPDGGGGPEPTFDALRWMIMTGADWDGPSAGRDSFDAAIDLATAHFAARYSDSETFRKIAGLIFSRHRRGLFVHDLVWGFFRTADAAALAEIAKYIVSDNPGDSRLACSLLGIEAPKTRADKEKAFAGFNGWLAENRPYIYVSDESFNASSVPCHLLCDAEAKHVKHEIDPRTRRPLTPYTEEEHRAIEVFRAAQDGGLAV